MVVPRISYVFVLLWGAWPSLVVGGCGGHGNLCGVCFRLLEVVVLLAHVRYHVPLAHVAPTVIAANWPVATAFLVAFSVISSGLRPFGAGAGPLASLVGAMEGRSCFCLVFSCWAGRCLSF